MLIIAKPISSLRYVLKSQNSICFLFMIILPFFQNNFLLSFIQQYIIYRFISSMSIIFIKVFFHKFIYFLYFIIFIFEGSHHFLKCITYFPRSILLHTSMNASGKFIYFTIWSIKNYRSFHKRKFKVI